MVVLGGILTSTLLDQLVTPAVFYKLGKPIAERVIAERKTEGKDAFGEDRIREADTPPFVKELPEPVTGD